MIVKAVLVAPGVVPMFVVIAVAVAEVVVVVLRVVVVVEFPQDVLQEVADVVVVEVVHQIAFAEWMSLVSVDRHVAPPMIPRDAEVVHLPAGRHIVVKQMVVADHVPVQAIIGVMAPANMAALAAPEPIPVPIHQVWSRPVREIFLEQFLMQQIMRCVQLVFPDWV